MVETGEITSEGTDPDLSAQVVRKLFVSDKHKLTKIKSIPHLSDAIQRALYGRIVDLA